MKSQGIIDLADKMIYEENSDWICFNAYFSKILVEADYDAFFLLFVIWINKYIENELYVIRIEKEYDKLPEQLEPSIMAENMSIIKEWQKILREKVYNKTDWFIGRVKKTLEDNRKKMVSGLIECISILGRNLAYAATMYDEKFERDWDVFSTMLCLQYPSYAKENIKEEFQKKYLVANSFISKYNVFVPQYYILCCDIYKTADGRKHNQDENKHNYKRIAKILAEIPEIYRLFLSGNVLKPSKERLDNQGCISIILHVPFERFVPCFIKEEKKYGYWDNYKINEDEKVRVCHPMHEVMVPCTMLYTRTDVDLYIESAYRKVEFEKIKRQIDIYEEGIERNKTTSNEYEVTIRNSSIPEKEQLLEKMENRSSTMVELLNSLVSSKGDDADKEIRKRMEENGFSRKVYYDLMNYYKDCKKNVTPEKDTIIALAFCMELELDDLNNLLISAGYILSPAIERDIIIRHFLVNKCYGLKDLNLVLEQMELKAIKGKKKSVT